jgi:hypothetical protein
MQYPNLLGRVKGDHEKDTLQDFIWLNRAFESWHILKVKLCVCVYVHAVVIV